MLIETFFAVTCNAAELRDLNYSRIAGQLRAPINSSSDLEAGGIDATDQTDTPPQDAIVSLDVRHSPLCSLAGAGAYRSLLALSITHTGVPSLSRQVWHRAAVEMDSRHRPLCAIHKANRQLLKAILRGARGSARLVRVQRPVQCPWQVQLPHSPTMLIKLMCSSITDTVLVNCRKLLPATLVHVDVSHNSLASLEGLQHLPALEWLDASHNSLQACTFRA